MKKFAFILMGSSLNSQEHRVSFKTMGGQSDIFGVRDYDEACALIAQLAADGYGAIELCGAFGEERTRELIELTDGKVAIGYVTHFSEQDGLFAEFFS